MLLRYGLKKSIFNMGSRIYFIADTHFGHKNIIKYENRPFPDVLTMDAKLIENWNAIVNDDDTVYILGDFTLKYNFDIVQNLCHSLKGHKILIRGNHDSLTKENYLAAGFSAVYPSEVVLPRFINGKDVVLSHYPPVAVDPDKFYLYGHVHGKWCPAEEFKNALCVSIERLQLYAPVGEAWVGEALRQKEVGTYLKVTKSNELPNSLDEH
jgi:calcineurin-like phosphoesterase family protein